MVDKTHPAVTDVKEVEGIIESMHGEIDSALDLQKTRENFERMNQILERKKGRLRKKLETVESTKETLKKEMRDRLKEEEELEKKIKDLKKEKSEIEYKIKSSEERLENIQTEKEKLNILAKNLRQTVDEMSGKVANVL